MKGERREGMTDKEVETHKEEKTRRIVLLGGLGSVEERVSLDERWARGSGR